MTLLENQRLSKLCLILIATLIARIAIFDIIDAILCKAEDIPEQLYEMIIGRAEGNPYHIEEFIKNR